MTDHKSRVAETPDEDPRGSDDYEQQWQDLDEKVLLVQILTELQQIRQALTQDDRDPEVSYRCRKCDEVVSAAARERHATTQHKAPMDMVEGLFEVVE